MEVKPNDLVKFNKRIPYEKWVDNQKKAGTWDEDKMKFRGSSGAIIYYHEEVTGVLISIEVIKKTITNFFETTVNTSYEYEVIERDTPFTEQEKARYMYDEYFELDTEIHTVNSVTKI